MRGSVLALCCLAAMANGLWSGSAHGGLLDVRKMICFNVEVVDEGETQHDDVGATFDGDITTSWEKRAIGSPTNALIQIAVDLPEPLVIAGYRGLHAATGGVSGVTDKGLELRQLISVRSMGSEEFFPCGDAACNVVQSKSMGGDNGFQMKIDHSITPLEIDEIMSTKADGVRLLLKSSGFANEQGKADSNVHISEFAFLATYPGDFNLDGAVDLFDFSILRQDFGQTGAEYVQGDVTGDMLVGLDDFSVLKKNFGRSVPSELMYTGLDSANAVPEPATGWLAFLAGATGLAMWRRHRIRSKVRQA